MKFTPIDDIANARSKKKRRQAFYTPLALVADMVRMASNRHGCRALEPSAGDGRIVHALLAAGCQVDAYELDDEMNDRCASLGATMLGKDFLASDPRGEYGLVVMNPPFQRGQAEKHIQHAYRHLSPAGLLISVAPWNFTSLMRDRSLDLPGCSHATCEALGEETFKESGAAVKTVLLFIDGPGECSEVCGFSNLSTANAAFVIESSERLFATAIQGGGVREAATVELAKTGSSVYGINWDELREHFAARAREHFAARAREQEPAEKPQRQQTMFAEACS